MAQTTEKRGGRFVVSLSSQGITLATAVSKNRDSARRRCLERYQKNHGEKVL